MYVKDGFQFGCCGGGTGEHQFTFSVSADDDNDKFAGLCCALILTLICHTHHWF